MSPDLINGLFELVGGYFTWMNAWILFKAKETKGVYWPTWMFFSVWGLWNLYYYPALGQNFSFYAGIILVAGNIAWVGLAVYYKQQQQRSEA